MPGIFATSQFDGKVGLAALHSCTGAKVVEMMTEDFQVTRQVTGDSQPLKKAPQWMKRPCGATFGFGGKLVSFQNQKTQVADATGQPKVVDHASISIKQVRLTATAADGASLVYSELVNDDDY